MIALGHRAPRHAMSKGSGRPAHGLGSTDGVGPFRRGPASGIDPVSTHSGVSPVWLGRCKFMTFPNQRGALWTQCFEQSPTP